MKNLKLKLLRPTKYPYYGHALSFRFGDIEVPVIRSTVTMPAGSYDVEMEGRNLRFGGSDFRIDINDALVWFGDGYMYREAFLYNCRGQRIIGSDPYLIASVQRNVYRGDAYVSITAIAEYTEYATEYGLPSVETLRERTSYDGITATTTARYYQEPF